MSSMIRLSYFLLISSLDYSPPASRRAEFKVTSALSRPLSGLQTRLKSSRNEIVSDRGDLAFSKHINAVEYFQTGFQKNAHPVAITSSICL